MHGKELLPPPEQIKCQDETSAIQSLMIGWGTGNLLYTALYRLKALLDGRERLLLFEKLMQRKTLDVL